MTDPDAAQFRKDLQQQVRGEVSFDETTLGIYATDAGIYQIRPLALVVPLDIEDVRSAVAVATAHGVSILPRGGGTSLGGQTVGASMVIDLSKHVNRILELNVAERWARVEPGLVLDELNAVLAPYGLHFAPDPATSSRATIGGMIGNNSSGTKSLVYGITRDHVQATRVLLADGTVLDFTEWAREEYQRRCDGDGREAEILSGFRKIIDDNRAEIRKRYPKVMRRVMGYGLDVFTQSDRWNLSKIIAGSEGTLGIVLEARLNLEPLPKAKVICAVHFADLQDAIRAVAPILEYEPSAVEIMDDDVIIRARKNLNVAPLCGFIQGDPAAVLIVEFFGETPDEAVAKAEKLAADLKDRALGQAWPILAEPSEQAKVWAVRKNGLGLILGMKGNRKPIPFIEDCCVPVEVLPEYIDQMLTFCKDRGVPVAMYAHASVGTIHVRPILDLRLADDIEHMKAIAEYAFGLVMQYGGAWSGEHGDGRVRSPFLDRYFGPQVYNALRDVKRLFDPAGLMNPGVIVDSAPMDQNLRYGVKYKTPDWATEYHYRQDGSFSAAVEMCTGIGACRQNLLGTMCPSYRATRDEEHSTRGRANALRLAMTGQLGPDGMTSQRLYEVMDLCLSCKSCKSECPSNVDLARLKSEFLQRRHDVHGTRLREKLVAGSSHMAARMAGWTAPLVNAVQGTALFRWCLEKTAGFDRRRALPAFARHTLAGWFAQRGDSRPQNCPRVVLFDDTFMNYHQPEVGISAVELLESCGYEVIAARAGCCQRPRISLGFLRKARREGEQTLRNLDAFIQQGLEIVVCEPACASALTDDLPDLIDDEALGGRIREHVHMIDVFLAREVSQGRLTGRFTSPFQNVVIHGHCHQKSLYGTTFMKDLLERVEGMSVEDLDTGCCGMAGAFGFVKEHYDLSLQIGEQRLFPAVRNRPQGAAVVACGFSCRDQIRHATGVTPVHWVQTIRGEADGQ